MKVRRTQEVVEVLLQQRSAIKFSVQWSHDHRRCHISAAARASDIPCLQLRSWLLQSRAESTHHVSAVSGARRERGIRAAVGLATNSGAGGAARSRGLSKKQRRNVNSWHRTAIYMYWISCCDEGWMVSSLLIWTASLTSESSLQLPIPSHCRPNRRHGHEMQVDDRSIHRV